ncbi:deoxyribodipyrimidine photo-lyase [Phenylobacterium sp.]|uniref:deoxyribodipyrimidine photo-lyase n=1 Tax=Phenylobacterium sp. TaxID=1871053 RepID=UPI002E347766|nr:deoxyribodipyrimidine photo-lyase [Phenylobacterium sp.]HEX2560949.1 deoxyribodipyrimidine photo-lyase [Phenylobacterium sp.]
MIQTSRIQTLCEAPPRNEADYVLYWMQQSQRAVFNPALEIAVEEANARDLPVLVGFGLTARYPEANARHYAFLLQGLQDVASRLAERGIGFVVRLGEPPDVALELSRRGAIVVCDRGYLKPQVAWRRTLAIAAEVRVLQVEGDAVVPVEVASTKHEFAARTIRPKIQRRMDEFIEPLEPRPLRRRWAGPTPAGLSLRETAPVLQALGVDNAVPPVKRFTGGYGEARRRLDAFLEDGFSRYGAQRGKPEAAAASHMSPYLHYGHISPVEIALAVRAAAHAQSEDRTSYLEELIVRRELAINHVAFEPAYDSYAAVPEWARKTLAAHALDPRPHLYTPDEFEAGATHDRYWNAAMLEMRATGYMHNHLRMYWGKKVLEWSARPEQAFETLLRLNNRWFLDGRDANSFMNVGWIFGLHDRPWGPQPVFGTVRSMGRNTFRKFDADAYVRVVEALAAHEGHSGRLAAGAV